MNGKLISGVVKADFLLDPDIIFLNHGSFGAAPRDVIKDYQEWQIKLETQPVHFLNYELWDHLNTSRQVLGTYLNANPDDLVFIPNATFGVNLVAGALNLKQDDEVLTTNHEYGACDNTWTFTCRKTGALLNHLPIPLPVKSPEDIAQQFWKGVSERTRIIFISHISSTTAIKFPVKEICRRARESGIITVIDGAHAPGQIKLDIQEIDADFYIGNCHKWMLAPKGSAFLYTNPSHQDTIEPLVISWGWSDNWEFSSGSDYLDKLQWWGTKDPSAYLATTAAINFQKHHNWTEIRLECKALLEQTLTRIQNLTGLPSPYSNNTDFYEQMAISPLPYIPNLSSFNNTLYDQYQIEIPTLVWNGQQFIRISIQGYNTSQDIDHLIKALKILLPQFTES